MIVDGRKSGAITFSFVRMIIMHRQRLQGLSGVGGHVNLNQSSTGKITIHTTGLRRNARNIRFLKSLIEGN